jgi:hypothetical protein
VTKLRRRMLIATTGAAVTGGLWFAPAALADGGDGPPPLNGPCAPWEDGRLIQDPASLVMYQCLSIGDGDYYQFLVMP